MEDRRQYVGRGEHEMGDVEGNKCCFGGEDGVCEEGGGRFGVALWIISIVINSRGWCICT